MFVFDRHLMYCSPLARSVTIGISYAFGGVTKGTPAPI
jgi:hypothetical protein